MRPLQSGDASIRQAVCQCFGWPGPSWHQILAQDVAKNSGLVSHLTSHQLT